MWGGVISRFICVSSFEWYTASLVTIITIIVIIINISNTITIIPIPPSLYTGNFPIVKLLLERAITTMTIIIITIMLLLSLLSLLLITHLTLFSLSQSHRQLSDSENITRESRSFLLPIHEGWRIFRDPPCSCGRECSLLRNINKVLKEIF